MPNGKPGDHPLMDLFVHNMQVFGPVIDELLWEIQSLAGPYPEASFWHELDINWFRPPPAEALESILVEVRDRLVRDAKARGWETEV